MRSSNTKLSIGADVKGKVAKKKGTEGIPDAVKKQKCPNS
jgi:hypothetical protein